MPDFGLSLIHISDNALGVFMGYSPAWLWNHWAIYETALANTPNSSTAVRIIRERIKALLAFDGRTLGPSLKMPILVLGARDDSIIPCVAQENLHKALSNSQLYILESGGHFFPITRTSETVRLISKFMDQMDE